MDVTATVPQKGPVVRVSTPAGAITLLSLALGLSLYYIVTDAIPDNIVPYFSGAEPFVSLHGGHSGWLLLHIIGGMTAVLIGPLQFSARLRRRYLTVHRWSGRVYLVSVAVSVTAAFRTLLLPHHSFGFRMGIAGLALAWSATTGLAYAAVLSRQIALHKEWMVRSYVVTLGFLFYRLLSDLLVPSGIATRPEIVSVISWLCWAPPLLVTEVVLGLRKIRHHAPSLDHARA